MSERMNFEDAQKYFRTYIDCEMRDPNGLDETAKAMLAYVKAISTERQQHIKRLEELEGALKMWIDYDNSDMGNVSCMINYAKALDATKQTLPTNEDKGGE
jgi:hypothetical protein